MSVSDLQISSLIDGLLSADNQQRQAAEATMKQLRESNGEDLLHALLTYAVADREESKASLALLMIKKQYLDDRPEEEKLWQTSQPHLFALRDQVSLSLNFQAQSNQILKRKADIICKCYRKLDSYPEMIQNLVALLKQTEGSPEELVKKK